MIGELRGTLLVALVGAFVLVGCEDDPLPPGDAGVDAAPSDGGGSDADAPMDADTPTDGEIPRDAPTAGGGQDAGMVDAGCSGAAACDDGLFCNGAEQCVDGACVPGTAPVVDDEIDCTVDSCDEDTDMVVHAPSDARCDDMDDCTMDTCTEGVGCTRPYICECRMASDCDDMNPCTDDSCGVDGVCVNANNTADCDDGVYCNGADTCSGGSCGHAGDPCAAGAECADSCDEATDSCFDTMGTACTDDGNVCTDNACDGSGSCVATNHSRGCDDGLFCNGADTCSGGSCGHTGDPCAGGGVCADSCNEMADNCFDPAGAPCDLDALSCTADLCDGSGTCAAGTPTAPEAVCASMCVDTSSDAAHCGGCDQPCSAGASCESSVCVCGDSFVECPSGCVASVLETIDPMGDASFSRLTLDDAGGVHVAYVDVSVGALKYAYRDPVTSMWSAETVVATGVASADPAIAVDGLGTVMIFFGPTLQWAVKLGGASTWTVETIDATVGTDPAVDVAFDGFDLHMSYIDGTTVRHAVRAFGSTMWTDEAIDSMPVMTGTAIAISGPGQIHIAYGGGRELGYAEYVPAMGMWQLVTADSVVSGITGGEPALVMDGSTARIVHRQVISGGSGSIRHSFGTLLSFAPFEPLATLASASASYHPQASLDAMGTLHVAHWTSSSLVYTTRTAAGLIQSRTLGSSGLTLSPGSIGFGVDVFGGVHFTRRLGATRGLGYIHRPPCP